MSHSAAKLPSTINRPSRAVKYLVFCVTGIIAAFIPAPWWWPGCYAIGVQALLILLTFKQPRFKWLRLLKLTLSLWLPVATVVFLVQGFTYPAATTIWWQAGPLRLSAEGIQVAFAIAFRLLAATSFGVFLALSVKPLEFLNLKTEADVSNPKQLLSIIAALAFAALPTLKRQLQAMQDARVARGFPRWSLRHPIAPLKTAIIALLVGVVDDAEAQLDVLHSRALLPPTSPLQSRWDKPQPVPLGNITDAARLEKISCQNTRITYLDTPNTELENPGATSPTFTVPKIELKAGSIYVLIGAAGSGRTTMLRLLSGTLATDLAEVENPPIAYWQGKTAAPNATPPTLRTGFCGTSRISQASGLAETLQEELALTKARLDQQIQVAAALKLEPLLEQDPATLSSGQMHKLGIAAASLAAQDVLCLDQPFAALDSEGIKQVWQLLSTHPGISIISDSYLPDHYLAPEELGQILATERIQVLQLKSGDLTSLGSITEVWRQEKYSDLVEDVTASIHTTEDEEAASTVLQIRTLSTGWGDRPLFTVNDLRLTAHQALHIAGTNGSGKTSLLRILAGVDTPTGACEYELSSDCATVLKDQADAFTKSTVIAEISDNLDFNQKPVSAEAVEQVLDELGLNAIKHAHPRECNSSQQALIALACALVRAPQVLIADEITANCDKETSQFIAQILLQKLSSKALHGLIFSSHDQAFISRLKHLTLTYTIL